MERPENLGLNLGGGSSGLSVRYQDVCWLLTGLSIGALAMYLLDPDRGGGRRAKIADQFSSKVSDLGEAAQGRAKDLGNRAKGIIHEVRSVLPGGGSKEESASTSTTGAVGSTI